jgi:hypothetical protein
MLHCLQLSVLDLFLALIVSPIILIEASKRVRDDLQVIEKKNYNFFITWKNETKEYVRNKLILDDYQTMAKKIFCG